MTEVVKNSFFWQNVTKENMRVRDYIRTTLLLLMFYKNALIYTDMDHWKLLVSVYLIGKSQLCPLGWWLQSERAASGQRQSSTWGGWVAEGRVGM